MDQILEKINQADGIQIFWIGAAVIIVWFLPALVALFFNRKHLKLISLACIPAGLSVIAWSGVLIWAFTGKMTSKLKRTKPSGNL
jgi:hypothetical protein